MLLPRSCPLCDRIGPSPCAACVAALERAPALPPPAGVDRCFAVLRYDDAGRELVARLKYRNARSTVAWLAVQMAAALPPHVAATIDVVTWLPTTRARRRERGFDQAELLARASARHLRLRCRALLVRGDGPPQTGRSRTERRAGPPIAARRSIVAARAPLGHVLLVDDVITTGTSVAVAAANLRSAGAAAITVVAAARTPLKRARSGPETLKA